MKKITCLSDIDVSTSEGYVLYEIVNLIMKLPQTKYANVDQLLREGSKNIKTDSVEVVKPCKKKNRKK